MKGGPRKAKDPRKTIARLLSYLKKYRTTMIIVVLCIVLSAGAMALSAASLGTLVDDYITPLLSQAEPDFGPLLKKPKILILDDSTSAVDTHTDAMIRKAFREEIPNTTKIIIAQRVASVEDADLILVMENGTIAAMGTHEQLLKTSPIYREVYESQTKGSDA